MVHKVSLTTSFWRLVQAEVARDVQLRGPHPFNLQRLLMIFRALLRDADMDEGATAAAATAAAASASAAAAAPSGRGKSRSKAEGKLPVAPQLPSVTVWPPSAAEVLLDQLRKASVQETTATLVDMRLLAQVGERLQPECWA